MRHARPISEHRIRPPNGSAADQIECFRGAPFVSRIERVQTLEEVPGANRDACLVCSPVQSAQEQRIVLTGCLQHDLQILDTEFRCPVGRILGQDMRIKCTTGDSEPEHTVRLCLSDRFGIARATSGFEEPFEAQEPIGWYVQPPPGTCPRRFGIAVDFRSGGSCAAGAAYTVTEMTSAHAGSWSAVASAINSGGVLVGYRHGKQSIAVRAEHDELIDLPADDGIALALGLADSGDVVGSVDDRAAIWSDGRLRLLAPDEPQTTATALYGGLVVGQTQSSTTSASALIWSGDEVTMLPSLGGPMSRAARINSVGVMRGTVDRR